MRSCSFHTSIYKFANQIEKNIKFHIVACLSISFDQIYINLESQQNKNILQRYKIIAQKRFSRWFTIPKEFTNFVSVFGFQTKKFFSIFYFILLMTTINIHEKCVPFLWFFVCVFVSSLKLCIWGCKLEETQRRDAYWLWI